MDNDKTPHEESADGSQTDPGEPVTELRDLDDVPTATFLDRLFRKIERRFLSVEVMEFTGHGIREVFLEFWKMIMMIFHGKGEDKGR